MAQYINKSVLVAEIKRLLAFYSKEIEDNKEDPWATDIAKRDILQEIFSFIDTLEVKEINIENEVDKYCSSREYNDAIGSGKLAILLAKHFFELGLSVSNKSQKGE